MFKVINIFSEEIVTVYHIIESNYGIQFLIYKDGGWQYYYARDYKPLEE